MIENTTKFLFRLHSQNKYQIKIPESVLFNSKYHIKIEILPVDVDIKDVHVDSIVEIQEVFGNQEIFYKKKFYNELNDYFLRTCSYDSNYIKEKIDSPLLDFCWLKLKILKPEKEVYLFYLEKSCINSDLIESIKTSRQNIDQLFYIAEQYLAENYRPVIAEIGKFGEYLIKILLKKIKRGFSNFKTGVNSLANYNPKRKPKINYNFIGNLLYPIYYLRNQVSHPDSEIPLDKKTASMCVKNLSCILQYLSENQIRI